MNLERVSLETIPIINKYLVGEQLEACGRADVTLIILYDDDELWAGGDFTEDRKGYDSILKLLDKYKGNANDNNYWNDVITDMEEYYRWKIKISNHIDNVNHIFQDDNLELIWNKGDYEGGYTYCFYPRWKGETEYSLNPLMLKDTSHRCGHEHDCCGCIFTSDYHIEMYDRVRDGWLIAQSWGRNI